MMPLKQWERKGVLMRCQLSISKDPPALCLFRVIQEALHNIAKHGHAKNVEVDVVGTPNKIHLKITDDGVGFAPNAHNKRHGVGLISMRERLYLVGGKFAIVSKRGCGTRVEATSS